MTLELVLNAIWSWLCAPGSLDGFPFLLTEPLASLGITPETRGGVMMTILTNLYAWITAARLCYSIAGRWCGFFDPLHFRRFLLIPWRPVWRRVRKLLAWWSDLTKLSNRANGGWASVPDRLCLTFKPGDTFLGRHKIGGMAIQQPAGIDDESYVSIIAGPGTGKTTHAISWVVTHPGSALIIDPKGQIAKVTARRKSAGGPGVFGQGKKVRILDPMAQVQGFRSAKWNLFDQLRAAEQRRGPDAVVRYAMKAADGLVLRTGKEANPFWPGISKEFLTGAILDVYTSEPIEAQSLGRLYDLICHGLPEARQKPGEDAIALWLWRMKNNKAYGGIIAASANALSDAGQETYGNILVTVREYLQWLKLPQVRRLSESGSAAEGTDVNLEDLAIDASGPGMVLYLCAPASDIRGTMAGYFRLLTIMALAVFEDLQPKLQVPCLLILDEFPALGRIEVIQVAAGLMRSMGVRLALIAQDTGQLRIYDNPEAFIGASTCLFMGGGHLETLSYIERAAGIRTIRRKVPGGGQGRDRYDMKDEPVVRAQDAKLLMGRGNIIVIRPFDRPLITRRTRYFDYMPVNVFDADRDFKEPLLRRLTRAVFTWLMPGDARTPNNAARTAERLKTAP